MVSVRVLVNEVTFWIVCTCKDCRFSRVQVHKNTTKKAKICKKYFQSEDHATCVYNWGGQWRQRQWNYQRHLVVTLLSLFLAGKPEVPGWAHEATRAGKPRENCRESRQDVWDGSDAQNGPEGVYNWSKNGSSPLQECLVFKQNERRLLIVYSPDLNYNSGGPIWPLQVIREDSLPLDKNNSL